MKPRTLVKPHVVPVVISTSIGQEGHFGEVLLLLKAMFSCCYSLGLVVAHTEKEAENLKHGNLVFVLFSLFDF